MLLMIESVWSLKEKKNTTLFFLLSSTVFYDLPIKYYF